MPSHKDLTGVDLHEPKGVETASVDTVYIADGAGSGTWGDPLASLNNANLITLTTRIADISTASSVFLVTPFAGLITNIYVTLHGAITGADATVTAEINGTPVGGIAIVCAYSGSAAGSVFSDTATSANTLTAGQALEIITDGASSTAVAADVTVVINVA